MSQEYQYLKELIAHENWHILQKGEKPQDLSCRKCYPVDISQVPAEFYNFWKYWAKPRSGDSIFTAQTIEYFEQLRTCSNQQQAENLFLQLVKTIRYPQIPNFEQLINTLHFYWEVTDNFNNWDVYYSDQSSNTSEESEMASAFNRTSKPISKTNYGFGDDDFDVERQPWGSHQTDRQILGTSSTIKKNEDDDDDPYQENLYIEENSSKPIRFGNYGWKPTNRNYA